MADLKQILTQATSLDTFKRTEAMQLLERWEQEPAYHHALTTIYMDIHNSHKIRSLAIICMKNGVQKYWRKTAKHCIQPLEKQQIRESLMQYFSEGNRQLAIQQAVVTSKIARYDFPTEWPLLDTLVPIVENSFKMVSSAETSILQFNSLYTLHLVLKTIVTKSLPAAKRIAQSITPNIFILVSRVLSSQLELFEVSKNEESLGIARIALKCLRRLVVHGYAQFSNAPEAVEFVRGLITFLPKFMKSPMISSVIVQKMIILIGKVYVDLSTERVVDLVLTPSFLEIVQMYWSILEQKVDLPTQILEKVQIQAMKLLKNVIKHRDFHIVHDKDARTPLAIQLLETKLFSPEFVERITKLLLTRYMVLSKEDIEFWEDDPESFVQDEDSDHWEYHPRQCAEKLFMTVISKHRNIVCPLVIHMLQNVVDSSDVLLKEVVYGAIASGSHDLFDYVDFDGWLPKLLQEAQGNGTDVRIIKRRIAQLLGKWISVKCSKESRGLVYESMYHLLNSQDLVVKVTSVINLQLIIDDFDFEKATFEPFCRPIIELLIRMVVQVDEFDSKSKIMQLIGLIVERMEGNVPIQDIISILPHLWTESEGQNLFRCSIVRLLGALIKTNFTIEFYPLVFPILQESLNTTKPGHLYLLEEGMEVWLATMEKVPQLTVEMVQLIPHAIELLQTGTETLKKAVEVLEWYIVIDPVTVLQSVGQVLLNTIGTLLQNLSVNASKSVFQLLDAMIQSCQAKQSVQQLIQAFGQTGLYEIIINGLQSDGWVVVGYCVILNRMWMYEPMPLTEPILDLMIEKFDIMDSKQKRVCAMGLMSCASTANFTVLNKFDAIVGLITSIPVHESDGPTERFQVDFIAFIKLKLEELGTRVDLNQVLESVDTDLVLQLKKMM